MNQQKRVLFLSITSGQGHNAAAKAVKSYLEEKQVQCRILDTYTYLSRPVGKGMDKGYTFIARYRPEALEMIFRGYEENQSVEKSLPFKFADLQKRKLARYIQEYDPDVIICPHVLACILVSKIREAGLLQREIPCIGINTDYSPISMWDKVDIDYIVVAADFLVPLLTQRGVSQEKLLAFGIPVDPKFEKRQGKEEARKKLGLEQIDTILVLSGGAGLGHLEESVQDLGQIAQQCQIVVVCGSNKRLKAKLEEFAKPYPLMKILGYTNNLDEYMDAADIVYTKPGGLTSTETLTKDKPLVLMDPLPGVESWNQVYFANHSLACITNDFFTGSAVVGLLLKDKSRQEEMAEARARLVKHNSAKALGDFALELAEKNRKI